MITINNSPGGGLRLVPDSDRALRGDGVLVNDNDNNNNNNDNGNSNDNTNDRDTVNDNKESRTGTEVWESRRWGLRERVLDLYMAIFHAKNCRTKNL